MADMDIDQLINEFGRNYPNWINSSIGPKMDQMVKSLNKLAGEKSTGGSGDQDKKKKEKDHKKNLDETNKALDKLKKTLGDASKGAEKLASASFDATKSLGKGDLTGAVDRLTYSMADLTKGSHKTVSAFGMASAAVLGLGTALNFTIKEMMKTRAAYAAMAEQGLFVRDGFVGLRKAAHEGNMSVEQLSQAIGKSTQSILALGPTGTAIFSRLSKAMREPEQLATKLGMNFEDVNNFLSQHLEIQRVTGRINKLNEIQRREAFNRQLREVTLFSGALGKARDQVMKTAEDNLKDPKSQNLMFLIMERLGEGGELFRENVMKMAMQMEGITKDPALSKKLTDMALAMYGEQMGVPIIDPAMKTFIAHMNNTAPELVKQITDSMQTMVLPSSTETDIKNSTVNLVEAIQDSVKTLNHHVGRIILQNPNSANELQEVFSSIYKLEYDLRENAIRANLENAGSIMEEETDKTLIAMRNLSESLQTVNTLFSKMSTDLVESEWAKKLLGTLDGIATRFDGSMINGFGDLMKTLTGESSLSNVAIDSNALSYAMAGLAIGGPKGAIAGFLYGKFLADGNILSDVASYITGTDIEVDSRASYALIGAAMGLKSTKTPMGAVAGAIAGAALGDVVQWWSGEDYGGVTKITPEEAKELLKKQEKDSENNLGARINKWITGSSTEYWNEQTRRQMEKNQGETVFPEMIITPKDGRTRSLTDDEFNTRVPQFASGGVAIGKMLAQIAEAGSPEMVLPLDPALHNMAKYNAEQMVDIYGSFARRMQKDLISTIFTENRIVLDEILTKSLNKFFESQADILGRADRTTAGMITGNDQIAEQVARYRRGEITQEQLAENIDTIKTSTAPSSNAQKAMQFFIDKGYTREQAAGIVGNLQAESGANLDINAVGDGGQAYGIAQWHPDRQRNFKKAFGKDIREATFEEQLAFIHWELENTEKRAGNKIKSAKTVEEAALITDKYYERSAGLHTQKRIDNARRLNQNVDRPVEMVNAEGSLPITDMSGEAGFGYRFGEMDEVKGLVVHHTAGRGNARGVINTFKERNYPAQYILDREGNIVRALPEGAQGQHMRAGQGIGRGLGNRNMEGIEVIAKDNNDWTEAQRATLARFTMEHSRKYGYDPQKMVFGHGEINSHKRADEGMYFVDWFRRNFEEINRQFTEANNPVVSASVNDAPLFDRHIPSGPGMGKLIGRSRVVDTPRETLDFAGPTIERASGQSNVEINRANERIDMLNSQLDMKFDKLIRSVDSLKKPIERSSGLLGP